MVNDDRDLARLEVAAQQREVSMRDGEMNDRQAAGVADRCVDGLLGAAKIQRRETIDDAIARLENAVYKLCSYERESAARLEELRMVVAAARQELEGLVLR